MSNIPAAREDLLELVEILKAKGLTTEATRIELIVTHQMVRTPAVRKSGVHSEPMTVKLVSDVKKFLKANPNMPLSKVGEKFNINGGRVSEILHGKWG